MEYKTFIDSFYFYISQLCCHFFFSQHVQYDDYIAGDTWEEQGQAAVPSKVKEFRERIETAITYCKALKCKRYNKVLHLKVSPSLKKQ